MDKDLVAQARPMNIRVNRIDPCPGIRYWLALQQEKKHEDKTSDEGEEHDSVEDPDLVGVDGNSEQKDTDRELDSHR
jgi:hypothetical protein